MGSMHRNGVAALIAGVLAVVALFFAFRMQAPGDSAIGDRVSAVSSEAATVPPPVAVAPTPSLGDPAVIRIPAIRVTADIVPTSVDSTGAVNIPEDISTVGWYAPGPRPGDLNGSAVIVGHRDGAVQGHGAFYGLSALSLGDRVLVTTSLGYVVQYRIVAREIVSKPKFARAAPEYFATSGPPRLTLITCGGYYDKALGGYQANVIVTAIPQA